MGGHVVHLPNTIPEQFPPYYLHPAHNKPDMIRIVGYELDRERRTYVRTPGQPISDIIMEIIECKISTDFNLHTVEEACIRHYTPLVEAIQAHGSWRHHIVIRPIVFSRTGATTQRTIAHVAALLTPRNIKEEPPDQLPLSASSEDTKQAIADINKHITQWLEAILLAAKRLHPIATTNRNKPRQASQKHTTISKTKHIHKRPRL